MPVGFLTAEQVRSYGRFSGEPAREQLERFFRFEGDDRGLVRRRRNTRNRLGYAVQLGTVRFLGTFVGDQNEVPPGVVSFVANELGVPASFFAEYPGRLQTQYDHATEIRDRFGYSEFSDPERQALERWLYARAWSAAERPSVLFDLATARLLENKVLLPGVRVLERLVVAVRDQAARKLWQILCGLPSQWQKARLESLLSVPDGARISELERLRRAPRSVSAPAMVDAIARATELEVLGVSDLDVSDLPESRLRELARYGRTAKAQTLRSLGTQRRTATLVATARDLHADSLDDLLDLLDQLLVKLLSRVERAHVKDRARTMADLDAAAGKLSRAVEALLERDYADVNALYQAVFGAVPRDQLAACVKTVGEIARPRDEGEARELLGRYAFVRQFLPKLLTAVAFDAAPGGRPVLKALDALRRIEGRKKVSPSEVPLDLVGGVWRSLVVRCDGQLDRRAYTLCILDKLREALRRRDVFVPGASRYADPREKLLSGRAWISVREEVCRGLELATDPEDQLSRLGTQLDDAYRQVAAGFDDNDSLEIVEGDAGHDEPVLHDLEPVGEPESLVDLREAVEALMPRVELPDLLLEVHSWTGFMHEFTHVAGAASGMRDLDTSICALMVAEACNVGLEPVQRPDVGALRRGRLSYVDQNFVRAETIAQANSSLVEYHSKLDLARKIGSGEIASVDGMRFVVPVRTLNAGPNPRYFGVRRGITWLNTVSDQFAGGHAIVVPGTVRDSLYVLDTLLEQDTIQPEMVTTDTASYSDQVFGLFHLLGYQFAPRLADLGSRRFWRIDPDADYGPLDGVARHKIRTDLIREHWDDILRVAGSLHRGAIRGSEILRILQGAGRPTRLGMALGEYGRIPKTLHMLTYVDDPPYRRQIGTQLNRHESRHSLGRTVFYGQRGELRQRYREGQEDQLGALGLVMNAIVLWNTRYMSAALDSLERRGHVVADADVARLSPLIHSHISTLGRYDFMTTRIAAGELRDLRDPFDGEHPVPTLLSTEVA